MSLVTIVVCSFMISNFVPNIPLDVSPILTVDSEGNGFHEISYLSAYRVLECEDGYVNLSLINYKLNGIGNSDLYKMSVDVEFVPGIVANANNTKRKNGSSFEKHNLHHGYVHATLKRYEKSESSGEKKIGGEISPKLYYPKSTGFSTQISSSYGTDFGISDSVKVDDTSKIEAGTGRSLQFSTTSSLTTQSSDPIISAQYGQNAFEMQWSFRVLNYDIAGSVTFHLNANIIFEMNKDYHNTGRDSFFVDFEFEFTGTHKSFGRWWECFDSVSTLLDINN